MRGRDFQENKPEMLQIWMTSNNKEFDKNHLLQRFLLKADRHIRICEACLVSKAWARAPHCAAPFLVLDLRWIPWKESIIRRLFVHPRGGMFTLTLRHGNTTALPIHESLNLQYPNGNFQVVISVMSLLVKYVLST